MSAPVKNPLSNSGTTVVATVQSVLGGIVRVSEHGGPAYDAIPPGDVDLALLVADAEVLVFKRGGEMPRIVTVYGVVTRNASPINTGWVAPTTLTAGYATLNGIPNSRAITLRGGDGIRIVTNPATDEITFIVDSRVAGEVDLANVNSISFSQGGRLTQDKASSIVLEQGTLRSFSNSDVGGWELAPDATWRFLRRESMQAGPDFTNEHFFWYGPSGATFVEMDDTHVRLGVPGQNKQLSIDLVDGLKLHGSAVTAETLDGTAIGPNLTRYISQLIGGGHPIAVAPDDSAIAGISPWSRGIVPISRDVALQITSAIELWVRGGTNGFAQDTIIFAVDLAGVRIGSGDTTITLDNKGNLRVPANAFVGGTLQAGERVLVGTGEWGVDFQGIAIDGDWGIIALKADQTWDQEPGYGTYQCRIDRNTGKLFLGGGKFVADEGGLQFTEVGSDSRLTLSWLAGAVRVAEFGADTNYFSHWTTRDHINPELTSHIFSHGAYGVWLTSTSPQGNILLSAPMGVEMTTPNRSVALFGDESSIYAPLNIIGTNLTTTWTERGWVGIGGVPTRALEVSDIVPQLRLTHSPTSHYADLGADAGGLTITSSNDIVLSPTTNYVLPANPYQTHIGSATRKFLTLNVAELRVDTLVAQDVRADIGGRVLVGSTMELKYDLQAADTVIFLKYNSANNGDIGILEARGNVEFIRFESGWTTVEAGVYRYTISRNLDGSGANKWLAGDALFNTGQTGTGWIDLYAINGINNPSHTGPTIVGNIRTGSAYNSWAPRWAVGRLTGGLYSQTNSYGAAFGDPNVVNVRVTDSGGFELYNGATRNGWWKPNGDIEIGPTGAIKLYANGTATFAGAFDGTLDWSDVTGPNKPADNADVTPKMPFSGFLEHYWPMDDSTLLDFGSQRPTKSNTVGATYSTSTVAGRSMYFSGTGQYIQALSPVYYFGPDWGPEYTFSAWVRPNTLAGVRLYWGAVNIDGEGVCMGVTGQRPFIHITTPAGSIRADRRATTDVINTTGSWWHIMWALNWTTSTWKCYVNGVEINLDATNVVAGTPANLVGGGISTASNLWNGWLDEFRCYASLLSAADARGLFYAVSEPGVASAEALYSAATASKDNIATDPQFAVQSASYGAHWQATPELSHSFYSPTLGYNSSGCWKIDAASYGLYVGAPGTPNRRAEPAVNGDVIYVRIRVKWSADWAETAGGFQFVARQRDAAGSELGTVAKTWAAVNKGSWTWIEGNVTLTHANTATIFVGVETNANRTAGDILIDDIYIARNRNVTWTGSAIMNTAPTGAGLYLGADKLGYYSGSAWRTYMDSTGNFYLDGANGPFVWTAATSTLTVAGWTANPAYFVKDTGTNNTSAGMSPVDYPFYAGATYANRATAPFRVTPAGAVIASNVGITGGTLGGWRATTTTLYSGDMKFDSANYRIYLNASNYLFGYEGAYIKSSGSFMTGDTLYIHGGLELYDDAGGSVIMVNGSPQVYLGSGETAVGGLNVGGVSVTPAYGTLYTAGLISCGGTLYHKGSSLAFFNTAAVAKQTVTGSRGGNAALASLLTALASYGLITDSTS